MANDELDARIQASNAERRQLMVECIEQAGHDAVKFIDWAIPQSELFMVEILPWIHKLYFSAPTNARKTVLDIGPQSFGGTRLLHSIHNPATLNKLKLDITAVDIHDEFEMLRRMIVPDIEFIKANIYDINDRNWDLVIASHVIEHVPQPAKFLRRCQQLAKDQVIVACPWAEDPLVTGGHINTINKQFVQSVGATDLKVYTNYNWGKGREVCIFTLPGLA